MKRNRNHRDVTARPTSFFEPLEGRQLMSVGSLDLTFGAGGRATTGFMTHDVAAQADGKTVAVGWIASDFAVMRFNVDGSPDASFGPGGLRTTDFGGKRGDYGQRVAIQNDGKILVAGLKRNSGLGPSAKSNFALVRYNANGTLDGGFGVDGRMIVLGEEKTSTMSGLGIQPGGKIVFSSSVERGGDDDFMVVRLHSNGILDKTFGDRSGSSFKGYATAGFGGSEYAHDQLIEPDGKIVVAGTQYGGTQVNSPSGQFALARFTASGQLDKTFSGDGKTSTTMIRGTFLGGIARQPDGKIVAAGSMRRAGSNNGSEVLLRRFNVDGSYDNTLRNGTVLTTPFPDSKGSIGNSVLVKDNAILVVGDDTSAQGSRLFAARYLLNGAPDTTFGSGGVAKLDVKTDPTWPRAALAPEGKVVVGFEGSPLGASGVARFIEFERPQVSIVSRIPDASEAGPRIGAVVVKRQGGDQRAALRVHLDVGGTATLDKDYTSTLKTLGQSKSLHGNALGLNFGVIAGGAVGGMNFVQSGIKVVGGGVLGGILGGNVGNMPVFSTFPYVEIPAGASSVTVPVSVVNDGALEPVETATFTVAPGAAYTVAADKTASVRIADDERLSVNFQRSSGGAPAGQMIDNGHAFGDRGNGWSYGWDADNRANSRKRNNAGSPDARYDTYNHMQKGGTNRAWEVALPDGLYRVRIVAGDPGATDSYYDTNLEGQLALSARPSGNVRWFRSTVNVQVSDGRLTLTSTVDAVNNKIAFIDIQAAPIDARPGVVATNLPVGLVTPATASLWTAKGNGLFADKQIDEPLWA